jgi:membrane associated rhomboid family serine protease
MEHLAALMAIAFPDTLFSDLRILLSILAVIWGLWIVDELLNHALSQNFTIRPRTDKGLPGVLGAPLFHQDLGTVLDNSWTFLIMGWFLLSQSLETFLIVTIVVWLFADLGFWLLAPEKARYCGSGGILFGYLGFLLLRGFFARSVGGIILSLFIALLFGRRLLYVLPTEEKLTWQAHLLGFIGGILVARYLPELQIWFEEILFYFG